MKESERNLNLTDCELIGHVLHERLQVVFHVIHHDVDLVHVAAHHDFLWRVQKVMKEVTLHLSDARMLVVAAVVLSMMMMKVRKILPLIGMDGIIEWMKENGMCQIVKTQFVFGGASSVAVSRKSFTISLLLVL